jgi:hypothetical protein
MSSDFLFTFSPLTLLLRYLLRLVMYWSFVANSFIYIYIYNPGSTRNIWDRGSKHCFYDNLATVDIVNIANRIRKHKTQNKRNMFFNYFRDNMLNCCKYKK